MKNDEFLRAIEQALNIEAGTLQPGLALADVPEWDSLGIVDFQGLVDENFGLDMPPERITACTTVDDLLALVASKLSG